MGNRWRKGADSLTKIAEIAARRGPWATLGALVGIAVAGAIAAFAPDVDMPPVPAVAGLGSAFAMALDRLGILPTGWRLRRLGKCVQAYSEMERDGHLDRRQLKREIDLLLKKYRL